MFHFLNTIITWIGSACALGVAAFWGWSSVFLNTKTAASDRLYDQAGFLMIVGLGVGIVIVGLYAMVAFTKSDKSAPESLTAKLVTKDVPDNFDPDAIIAWHLANRVQTPVLAFRGRSVDRFHSVRKVRSFGNKIA